MIILYSILSLLMTICACCCIIFVKTITTLGEKESNILTTAFAFFAAGTIILFCSATYESYRADAYKQEVEVLEEIQYDYSVVKPDTISL